jgi:hypothetical protein
VHGTLASSSSSNPIFKGTAGIGALTLNLGDGGAISGDIESVEDFSVNINGTNTITGN